MSLAVVYFSFVSLINFSPCQTVNCFIALRGVVREFTPFGQNVFKGINWATHPFGINLNVETNKPSTLLQTKKQPIFEKEKFEL